MDPGTRWGYRARNVNPLVEVEVVRIGTKRPARVLVRFVDAEQEGHEDWVPPARLKTPWREAGAWLAREKRWEAVRDISAQVQDTDEERAAWLVMDWTPHCDYASLGYNRTAGILTITDLDRLVAETDLSREDVTGHPLAFTVGDSLVVPWEVTMRVVRALARRHAEHLLRELERDKKRRQQEMTWGQTLGRGDTAIHISPETIAAVEAEYEPSRNVLRRWCGQEARERVDELTALREEVLRLGQLIEHAVQALRAVGATRQAKDLERALGVPISMVQQRAAAARYRDSGP